MKCHYNVNAAYSTNTNLIWGRYYKIICWELAVSTLKSSQWLLKPWPNGLASQRKSARVVNSTHKQLPCKSTDLRWVASWLAYEFELDQSQHKSSQAVTQIFFAGSPVCIFWPAGVNSAMHSGVRDSQHGGREDFMTKKKHWGFISLGYKMKTRFTTIDLCACLTELRER